MSNHIDKCLDLERLAKLKVYLQERYEDDILAVEQYRGELSITVRRGEIVKVLRTLRDDKKLMCRQLLDVTAVDWLGEEEAHNGERFEVVYHLLSVKKNFRLRVKTPVPDEAAVLSVVDVFGAANWYEREVFDMFGITFEGHPDLRRILTDYDFVGHPLRKDFPLNGFTEIYYDTEQQRLAYKPVDLPQELRDFNAVSPWKGMDNNKGLADEANVFDLKEFTAPAEPKA